MTQLSIATDPEVLAGKAKVRLPVPSCRISKVTTLGAEIPLITRFDEVTLPVSVTGLPRGVEFHDGIISGVPAKGTTGNYDVEFRDCGELSPRKAVKNIEFHGKMRVNADSEPKPAEHVIEIKTRHLMPKGEDHCYVMTTVPNSGNDGKTLPCIKTRELWIDGQKFGEIKGLD